MTEQLTKEQYVLLPCGEQLKYLIKRSEERILDWKKQLENYHKDRLNDEGFKEMLREGKNSDEKWLKRLRDEATHHNQGLNPPFCYPDYKSNVEQEQTVNAENK
jgi:hypothetical protein